MKKIPLHYRLLRIVGHQKWLPLGGRTRLLHWLCESDSIDDFEFECNFYGLQYQGNLNNFLDWSVYFYGAYEIHELDLFYDLLKSMPGSIVLDIGANIGQHTLFMSKYSRLVHAFEPYEKVFESMKRKVEFNGIKNVHLHNVALSNEDEELNFYAPQGANLGTGSFVADFSTQNNRLLGKIKLVRGDRYLSNQSVGNVSLIKIDVEGFEKKVLLGLCETLISSRPIICMEISSATKKSFTDLAEFKSLFPEKYIFKTIETFSGISKIFKKQSYAFKPFYFNETECDIIAYPEEKLNVVFDK